MFLETKYFGSNQQSTSLVSILRDNIIFDPYIYSHPDDIEGEVAKGVENDHHNQHFHKLQVTTMETWIRKLMKMMIDCEQNTNLTMIIVFDVKNNQD